MNQSLCILGRQPKLGLAELESLYGAESLEPFGNQSVIINKSFDTLNFNRLGGSTRLCQVLIELPTNNWSDIEKQLINITLDNIKNLPPGKLKLGISVFGIDIKSRIISTSALKIKKAVQATDRSMRFIGSSDPALNTASVFHNRLTSSTGCELVVVVSDTKTIVAKTIKVQNIDSYTIRDRSRPKRDSRIGMLPPKLAQIIINLAVSQNNQGLVLDPFCGTGVVLQEASLMGYDVYGTDIDPRMVEYSTANLEWLRSKFKTNNQVLCQTSDAVSYTWRHKIDFVASEVYLGRPFTSPPKSGLLDKTVHECNTIIKKFLQNLYTQLSPGTRLCLAVPAWQVTSHNFQYLPLIDQLSDLGYNLIRFEHVTNSDLLYYREDQIVARELLVITRK